MKAKALCLFISLPLVASQALGQINLGGNDTTADVGVANCTSLVEQDIPLVAINSARYCIATGSSDVRNPNQVGNHYYAFNLTLDNMACAPLNGGKERTVGFDNVNNFEWDNRIKEITSTGFFKLGPGIHTIRWTARSLPGAVPVIVDDSSLSVACTEEGIDRLPETPIPD